MSGVNESFINLQKCFFPNSLCSVSTNGKNKLFDISTGKIENYITAGNSVAYAYEKLSESGDIEMSFCTEIDKISASAISVVCFLHKSGMSEDEIFDSITDNIFNDTKLNEYNEHTASHIPIAALELSDFSQIPVNLYSMKLLPEYASYLFLRITAQPEGDDITVDFGNELTQIDKSRNYFSFAIPLTDNMDLDNNRNPSKEYLDSIDPIFRQVFQESFSSKYIINKPSVRKPVSTSFAGKSTVEKNSTEKKTTSSFNTNKAIEEIKKRTDSCLNSDENVVAILNKIISMGDVSDNDRKAPDLFKKATSANGGLKVSANTNNAVCFNNFVTSLDEINSPDFEKLSDIKTGKPTDTKYCAVITSTDAKKIDINTADEKRALVVAVFREFMRMVVNLFGENGEIPESKFDIVFSGNAKVSSGGGNNHKVGVNNFNATRVSSIKSASADSSGSMGSKISGSTIKRTATFAKNNDTSVNVVEYKGLDLYDLEEDKYKDLHEFRWRHVNRQARIIEAHDGDTLNILVSIPVNEFQDASHIGRGGKKQSVCYLDGTCHNSGSYIMNFKVRCYNIDAAETYTEHGLKLAAAMTLLQNYLEDKKVPVTVTFQGSNTYDREVAEININGIDLSSSFDKLRLNVNGEEEPLVLYPYSGAKKSNFSKRYLCMQGGLDPETATDSEINDCKLKKEEQEEFLQSDECKEAAKLIMEQFITLFNLNDVKVNTPPKLTKSPSTTAATKFGVGNKMADLKSKLANKISNAPIEDSVKPDVKAPAKTSMFKTGMFNKGGSSDETAPSKTSLLLKLKDRQNNSKSTEETTPKISKLNLLKKSEPTTTEVKKPVSILKSGTKLAIAKAPEVKKSATKKTTQKSNSDDEADSDEEPDIEESIGFEAAAEIDEDDFDEQDSDSSSDSSDDDQANEEEEVEEGEEIEYDSDM